MRILQVIHDFLPHHAAGSELYTFYLSKELARRHSVYVMYTEVDHARPQYYFRRSRYAGLPYYEVTHNHIYRRFEDTYADRSMEKVFGRVLEEVRPDVVHFQHLLHHSIGYISMARKRGIPVVATLHDYWLSCPNGGQRIRPDLEVCEEIDTAKCADCIQRYTGASYWASRIGSRMMRRSSNGGSLIDVLPRARVESPRPEFVGSDRFVIAGETRSVLKAHPPSRVAFRVKGREGTSLRFGVGMHPATYDRPGEGVAFEIRAGGESLWSRYINPKARAEDRRWIDDQVVLPGSGNGSLEVELVTRPSEAGDHQFCTAGWSGLELQEPADALPSRLSPLKSLYRAVERFVPGDSAERRRALVERRLQRVRAACEQVDLFLSPSNFLAERMVEFGLPAERVKVSDNGMRTDLLQPFRRSASERVRFGYIGTLVPHKGVHVLLDAFRKLMEGRPADAAELEIHGNPNWFPDYVGRLRKGAPPSNVHFLGEFDNGDVMEIFAGIDVLVVPSVWWENSPITIHEAILTGTPVIASDFGGMRDFVRHGENGLLFRRGDAADLARQLQLVVEEPGRLQDLSRPVVPIKTIQQDAADMEARYLRLVGAPAVAVHDAAGATP